MTHPTPALPDAEWLATADAALLEAEIDRASAALRVLTGEDAGAALAGVTNVLRRTLENGSELDPLPPKKARPLVLAALVFVRNHKDVVAASGEKAGTLAALRRLHRRREEFGNPAIQKNLDELEVLFRLASEADQREEEQAPGPPGPALPAIGASTAEQHGPRPTPLEEWLAARSSLEPGPRAEGDLRFLAAFSGRPIPTSFAEALYGDDDLWGEPALARWLDDRGEPFDADREGVAAAALLNSRVRAIRPRFFLRSPSSLVVQPIANAAEVEELRNEVRHDFVVRALSTVFDARAVLEAERRRGPKATVRKSEVLSVSDTLKAMFSRLGYDERPAVGTELAYDPVDHHGAAELASQEPVIVSRPGLWDLSAQRYVIRPVVLRPGEGRRDASDPDGPGDAVITGNSEDRDAPKEPGAVE